MTKEDIIRMAQEAGFDEWWDNGCSSWDTLQETFERFAALVVATEREACAQVCDEYEKVACKFESQWRTQHYQRGKGASACAWQIRQRGTQ